MAFQDLFPEWGRPKQLATFFGRELLGAAVTGGYTIQPSHPRHDNIIVNSMTSILFCPSRLSGEDGLGAIHSEMAKVFEYVSSTTYSIQSMRAVH